MPKNPLDDLSDDDLAAYIAARKKKAKGGRTRIHTFEVDEKQLGRLLGQADDDDTDDDDTDDDDTDDDSDGKKRRGFFGD